MPMLFVRTTQTQSFRVDSYTYQLYFSHPDSNYRLQIFKQTIRLNSYSFIHLSVGITDMREIVDNVCTEYILVCAHYNVIYKLAKVVPLQWKKIHLLLTQNDCRHRCYYRL